MFIYIYSPANVCIKNCNLNIFNLCAVLEWLRKQAPTIFQLKEHRKLDSDPYSYRNWNRPCVLYNHNLRNWERLIKLPVSLTFISLIFLMSIEKHEWRNKPKEKLKRSRNIFFYWNIINLGYFPLVTTRNYASVWVFLNKFGGNKEFCLHKIKA